MAFFASAITTLQTLVIALGAGLGVWGVVNLLEGYGSDNPGSKSQGMDSEVLCSSLAFRLCISLFVPIDLHLLFWYCIVCKSPYKTLKSGGKTNDRHKKAQRRRTDGSHPRNRSHHPRRSDSSASRIHPGKQLQRQYPGGGRAKRPHHRPQMDK